MTFNTLILNRQSVRRYAATPVEPEKLNLCLEAARLAPSAHNAQPWKYIVVDKEPLRTGVANATFSEMTSFNKFTLQAPVIVVITIQKPKLIVNLAQRLKKKEWSLIDIGISAEHFCLQATELGLGTCMLGWFDEKKISRLLKVPTGNTVGLLISVGYPVEGYPIRTKNRKPLDGIVSYNSYEGE